MNAGYATGTGTEQRGSETHRYRSWVEIDLDNFRNNWEEIKELTGPAVGVLQVVKADAYGHGAIEISKAALKNGACCLGVANADEGIQLRISGISAPIVILSPSTYSEIDQIVKYRLIPSVSDVQFARRLNERFESERSKAPVHLEVDTGMGRGGTIYPEAVDMVETVMKLPRIEVAGIFSHLSSSEEEDEEYNRFQWERFRTILEELERRGIRIPLRHISNSGGILNFPSFHLDMVRPGIMTYGIYPSPKTEAKASLAPVMSFKTTIVLIKDFPENYSIGYGRAYVTKRPSRIATIPVGYGDGYGFILSNQAEALIRGKRVPIVGRISMDMCTLDVTDIADCEVGDEVVLMGRQGSEYISANEIARKAGTISYEVLCVLGKRAPRVFVNKGEPGAVEPRLRRIFVPDEEKSFARIDSMIRSCFQARAESVDLGDAIYYEMFETLFGREDRQLELRSGFIYDIRVSDIPPGEGDVRTISDYFRVATHIEYTKVLRNPLFMIGCALNNTQLAALFEEEKCEYRWLIHGRNEEIGEADFTVAAVRIDGQAVPIVRSGNTKRGYEVWCGGDELIEKMNRDVKIEIEIVTKKYKSSNYFSVYLAYPTRGMEINFHYGETDLKNVREVSFFAGRHPYPDVSIDRGRSVTLKISDDDWVFPNSGVTFLWEL
ncbi:MAG: alanine racemase [Deltaproteobacteria bacterium]|nr:alanine racemase [Deltaproteobacteria bacterium]